MTQQQLVDRLEELGWKIHPTALTKIEKGERSLRMSQLELVADVLDVDPLRVLTYDPVREEGRELEARYKEAVRAMKDFLQWEELFAEGLRSKIVQGWEPSATTRSLLAHWQGFTPEAVLHFAAGGGEITGKAWDSDDYMRRRFGRKRPEGAADGQRQEAP